MRFWDASALVPLCVHEKTTASARTHAKHGSIVTWCLSGVEIASAIERKTREGRLTESSRAEALRALRELGQAWTEITTVEAARDRALRLLATQSLRAADALQLGAALVAVGDRPQGHEFLCLDLRLVEAARREGFDCPDLLG